MACAITEIEIMLVQSLQIPQNTRSIVVQVIHSHFKSLIIFTPEIPCLRCVEKLWQVVEILSDGEIFAPVIEGSEWLAPAGHVAF